MKDRSYNIVIGRRAIDHLAGLLTRLKVGTDAYIITNPLIKKKYGGLLAGLLRKARFGVKFKTVPDGEKSKSLRQAASLISDIAAYDRKRRIFIIALGGGVVGDLAGFVASIYKRGVPYIQVPTTLLAQVDSGIGGKTAVDLAVAKNLVGAIYQPKLVLSDISFLRSLAPRQVRSGMAEIIKYGIIKDAGLFSYLEKKYADCLALKQEALTHVIERSSSIKARIVEQDEREEKGIRTALNFGHTIGHAIEAASGFKLYNHGESVALGMLVAAEISKALGLIDGPCLERIEALIKNAGLPTRIKGIPLNSIINAHYRDKKFIGRKNRLVLIRALGKTKIAQNLPLETIRQAIEKRM